MLTAISPIDGRYSGKTRVLYLYFSEYALIKYRVKVELLYFKAICDLPLPQLKGIDKAKLNAAMAFIDEFSEKDAAGIKEIERTTNHDVKAVEYYLKGHFERSGLSDWKEFIHFGLTSQDINNTAFPLMLRDALQDVMLPEIKSLISRLENMVIAWKDIPMLARTHGQAASPTLLGKEIQVFIERLQEQLKQLEGISLKTKFGGATGSMNAHYAAYPDINWHQFADSFSEEQLGLNRARYTTQIEHYDNLAAVFHAFSRINTVLIDFCRDIWTYISMDYFKQKVVKGEIGSSAMPHKVNPIDFENAEGNLGLANAVFHHLAEKLPISRLQRDLTDSTVMRNIGVPFAHSLIALLSIQKGLDKLILNEAKLRQDLEDNWMVVAEALQTILRREGYEQPYESLLALTRGSSSITKDTIRAFIDTLKISQKVKEELKSFTPQNYIGRF